MRAPYIQHFLEDDYMNDYETLPGRVSVGEKVYL
jgi:hypothetical protein